MLVEVTTEGDVSAAPLATIGGTGVFVSALRDALLRGEVDLAVHSLKDLPTAPARGHRAGRRPAAGGPPRRGRRPRRAHPRRAAGRLRASAPARRAGPRSCARSASGSRWSDIRGNVDTRIGKVASGELDAVVLARAGLARLGRLDEVTEVLDPLQMLPAPGQGALAVECRVRRPAGRRGARAPLDDPRTRAAVTAERAVLADARGRVLAPVGALAEVAEGDDGDELWVRAVALSPDGARRRTTVRHRHARRRGRVGQRARREMLAEGATTLIRSGVMTTSRPGRRSTAHHIARRRL